MPFSSTKPGTTLVIVHMPGSDPPAFQIVRLSDGKVAQTKPVQAPFGFPVEGRPNNHLMQELQWYLEDFLDYPFPPETDRADRVMRALKAWGEQTFEALFRDSSAARLFEAATLKDYSQLHLQIASDNPGVLAWPWEALRDPEVGVLGQTCQIERSLNTIRDPQPLPLSLPRDRVNILLVVARPFGAQDVGFHSIARPLVDLIEKEDLPVHVEVLRPPTFGRLRERLRERPGFYHILHFDGHGSFSVPNAGYGPSEGRLVFETNDGEGEDISAEKLSTLLKEFAVPGVVLNACQSAMLDPNSEDVFASVATALLRSGMRCVVAMAYSLYVSGAQKFLPAFYRCLFQEGSMARAVRAGRQKMWQDDKRVSVRGNFPLQDWLLPVLYQQAPIDFSFAVEADKRDIVACAAGNPKELTCEQNQREFIGRDNEFLELERAMRRPPAGVLIQGLGGVGKTTLARAFLQWLKSTGGIATDCFWFSFQEIRSAKYVVNRLGETILGPQFARMSSEQGIDDLAAVLRRQRYVVVWDNFESAAGIPGTSVSPNLSQDDRDALARFLEKLRGGVTKVLITSRSVEDWLGPQRRFLLRLSGLDPQERWEYCESIVRDLGLVINRDDATLIDLMDALWGHPLAMRVILPQLEKMSATELLDTILRGTSKLNVAAGSDQAMLYATVMPDVECHCW